MKSSGVNSKVFELLLKRLKKKDEKITNMILKKIEYDEKGLNGFKFWKRILAHISEISEVENIELWESVNKRRRTKTTLI